MANIQNFKFLGEDGLNTVLAKVNEHSDELKTKVDRRVRINSTAGNSCSYMQLGQAARGEGPEYLKISFPQIPDWTMATMELTIRQSHTYGYSGKLMIWATQNNRTTNGEANGWTLCAVAHDTLTEDIKVYGSDRQHIYIHGIQPYGGVSLDNMLIGDLAVGYDLTNMTFEWVASLPETYQTATMYYGRHSGNETPISIDTSSAEQQPLAHGGQFTVLTAATKGDSSHNIDVTKTTLTLPAETAVNVTTTTGSALTPAHGEKLTVVTGVAKGTNSHDVAVTTQEVTIPSQTSLSKGTDSTAATTLSHGGTFTAITETTVSGHKITDTTTTYTLPSETSLSVTDNESGNAITDVTVSGHLITLKRGTNFLTAHPDVGVGTDSTSTATLVYNGTFTAVDSVIRDDNGHVTKINTKTCTLPTDTSKASKAEFDGHTSNTNIHITSTERSNWNAAKTHADSTHAPSNAEANVQSDWNVTDATSDAYIKNKVPFKNGTGSNSVIYNDGVANGQYSVAGGSASKALIENMFGSLATSLSGISVESPKANGIMSVALGSNTKAESAGTIVSGFGTIAGIKGYYWWSFSGNTIQLATTRPSKPTSTRPPPTAAEINNFGWQVGDLIVINNGTRYSNIKITAVDKNAMTITVDQLPFTAVDDDYFATNILTGKKDYNNYYHDTPNDRFIYAFKENSQEELTDRTKPRWEARGGEIEFGFASSSQGIYNISAGMLSTTENYNNLAVSDYAHVEGRKNIGGYGAHVEGANNEGWGIASHTEGNGNVNTGKYAHAEGRENTVTGANSHAGGYKNTVSGANSHAGGYKNRVSSGYSFSTGVENELTSSATQSFASGRANYIDGTDSIAVGRGSRIYSSKSSSFGGRNKLSLPSGSEGYQFSAGQFNNVNNPYGVAFGYYNNTSASYQTVLGKLNQSDSTALLIIGNGSISTSEKTNYTKETDIAGNTVYTDRQNVFTVKDTGKVLVGTATTSSDTALTLTTKGYVEELIATKILNGTW